MPNEPQSGRPNPHSLQLPPRHHRRRCAAPRKFGDAVSRPAFLPSPTAICTSATPRPSASTSASPTSSAARPTCASTTPTLKRKSRSTSIPSWTTSAGWASSGTRLCYASDYFGQLYEWASQLIKAGKAYVDDLTADEIRQHRGTLTEPGKDSPYRNRSVEENLDLFARMKAGEFPDGARVLRAKIDMASPNLNMRDPVMYRILHATHHRTGDEWCIYPMYDYAHGQSDSIERITHSMCTLEFADHQPLYRWYIEQLGIFPSAADRVRPPQPHLHPAQQAQAAAAGAGEARQRLGRSAHAHALRHPPPRLYAGGHPRLLRRHRRFAHQRQHRHRNAGALPARRPQPPRPPRHGRAAPAASWSSTTTPKARSKSSSKSANNPEDPSAGTRQVPFSREIYIEQDDFREVPPPKYYRLSPGKEVRLRNAYFITAQSVVKDAAGNVVEVHCTYDPASRGGNSPDGRKVKSTIHWVSAAHAIAAEIRLYDKLFPKPDPDDVEEGAGRPRQSQSQLARDRHRRQARAIARRAPSRATASSSSASAISAWTRTQPGQTGLQPHPAAQRLLGQDRKESRRVRRGLLLEERLGMNGECSRCKRPLTVENASSIVARTGNGRCRSCENEHTKGRSRTLGGGYTLGRSQAKFNNHKWELSFQQYAAIVASGTCFYCGNPLPTAAAGLDRKENEDYSWDTVFPCCGKQPRAKGPRGCNETKSHEIVPILLFVRRWYERSGKLPTEQRF